MSPTTEFEKQLRALRADYVERREAIHIDSHHTEEAVEKDFAEQVTQRENDDVLDALDDEARQLVMRIDNALLRIKKDEYGLCLSCSKSIPTKRLQAVPYAEYCIDCAEQQES